MFFQIIAERAAGRSKDIKIQFFLQHFHDAHDAAGAIEVFHVMIIRSRVDLGDVRNAAALEVKFFHDQVGVDAELIGDRAEMDDRIGGAAGSHQILDAVLQRTHGKDIARTDPFFHQFHDPLAGVFGDTQALVINRRRRASVRECHA